MTLNQARWASSHDWHVYSFEEPDGGWSVCVLESGSQLLPDGSSIPYTERHVFSDYKALRAWAGY
jgi:hypothetical protein